jgi:hypothetical protein
MHGLTGADLEPTHLGSQLRTRVVGEIQRLRLA